MEPTNWNLTSPEDAAKWVRIAHRLRAAIAKQHGEQRRLLAAGSRSGLSLSFQDWCQTFLPEHFRKGPSLMHLWLFRWLETMHTRRGEKLNVLAPRGGAKSTIGTLAYPLRMALERCEAYIWIVSDTFDQANTHLENIRQAFLDSPKLQSAYPSATGKHGPLHRAGVLEFRNGVRLEAYGTGQRIRGRRHGAFRPSLIICDDLQNDQHSRSSRQRANSREWFFGTLLKAGNAQTNFIDLATALHRDALAMELSRTAGWKTRIFKALPRFPQNMALWEKWEEIYTQPNSDAPLLARRFYESHRDAMHEGAVVLWPEEEDLYSLMKMRAEAGHAAFEREKQNEPINPELCEWDERCFDGEGFWIERFPENLAAKTMALDPSKGKDANHGDYSAYVLLGMDEHGELYVDSQMLRCPIDELVEAGISLLRTFEPDVFGVEGNQFQDLLADIFMTKLQEQRLPPLRPCLLNNRVSKVVRIRRLGSYLTSRKLHFLNSPHNRLLVEQMRQFPVGDHDDGPDALEMAIRLLNQLIGERHFDDGLGSNLLHRRG